MLIISVGAFGAEEFFVVSQRDFLKLECFSGDCVWDVNPHNYSSYIYYDFVMLPIWKSCVIHWVKGSVSQSVVRLTFLFVHIFFQLLPYLTHCCIIHKSFQDQNIDKNKQVKHQTRVKEEHLYLLIIKWFFKWLSNIDIASKISPNLFEMVQMNWKCVIVVVGVKSCLGS